MCFGLMVSEALVAGQLALFWVRLRMVVGCGGTKLYLMVARKQKENEGRVRDNMWSPRTCP